SLTRECRHVHPVVVTGVSGLEDCLQEELAVAEPPIRLGDLERRELEDVAFHSEFRLAFRFQETRASNLAIGAPDDPGIPVFASAVLQPGVESGVVATQAVPEGIRRGQRVDLNQGYGRRGLWRRRP